MGAAFGAAGHVLVAFSGVQVVGVGVLDSGFECLGFGLATFAHLVSSCCVVILHPSAFMALGVSPSASEA
ncbi:MAG: hypothetical protein LKF41_03595 [Bifidobacterium sp.]|nr:hypothetical protein [Bifidobacterium sp.]